MVKKALLWPVVLAAAVGIPVACLKGPDYWSSVTAQQPAPPKGPDVAAALGEVASDGTPSAGAANGAARARLEGTPPQDLAEVFRFDVTTDWIVHRWSRVSTGLADLQLQGYRVPLVTGTSEADLAGSLTYYFNARQKVQRITFRGTTGDINKLVTLLTEKHRFARRLTNSPSLMLYEIPSPEGKPKGTLKIQPAQVVKANEPFRRFDVELMIERPEEKT